MLSPGGVEFGRPAPSAPSTFWSLGPVSSLRLPIASCLHTTATGDVSKLPGAWAQVLTVRAVVPQSFSLFFLSLPIPRPSPPSSR